MKSKMSVTWSVVLAASLLVGFAACSAGSGSVSVQRPEGELTPEAVEKCKEVFSRTVSSSKPQLLVVVDRTASNAVQPIPQGLVDDMVEVSKDDGGITLIAVGGEGVAPRIVTKRAALSVPGARDRRSVRDLAAAMPSCFEEVLLDKTAPRGTGTDLYRAMAVAGELITENTRLWTLTDGISTVGAIDLDATLLTLSPKDAVSFVADQAPLDLKGLTWRVFGLGGTTDPLTTADRTWLRSFTRGLCKAWNGDGCEAIQAEPVDAEGHAPGLPADDLPKFPKVEFRTAAGSGCTYSLPSVLLFDGDSAELRGQVDHLLAEPVSKLRADDRASAHVVGHAATTPTSTEAGLRRLSRERAEAVAGRMTNLGVDRARLQVVGVGDDEAEGPILDPRTGQQNEQVAARERRVDVRLRGTSCSR